MSERNNDRLGAVAAVAGALTLFLGTLLHPAKADPNDPLAAFTEYAADRLWVASHLLQLFGIILIVVALVLLARRLSGGSGAGWARLGEVGAGASLALAAALQAVDGVALKVMVNRWAAASAADKDMLFLATFAVRQLEVGLASIFSLLMGMTGVIYGLALLLDGGFPRWLGGLAIAGGIPVAVASILMAYMGSNKCWRAAGISQVAVASILMAYMGFSGVAMTINLSASSLLLVWMMVVGGWMWRQAVAKRSNVA